MDLEETPWADATPQSSSQPASQETSQASTKSSAASATTTRGSRTTPRRLVAQPTRLEAVDDPLGPLGPLGQGSDTDSGRDIAPVPPLKEVARTTVPPQLRKPAPTDPHRIG